MVMMVEKIAMINAAIQNMSHHSARSFVSRYIIASIALFMLVGYVCVFEIGLLSWNYCLSINRNRYSTC